MLLSNKEDVTKWHLVFADYYQKHCADRGFMVEDFPYHLVQAGAKQRLIQYYRTDKDSMRTPAFIKQRNLQALRCQSGANADWPGSAPFMVCPMCANGFGILTPSRPARDACITCGEWSPPNLSNVTKPAYLCMKHAPHSAPGVHVCGLCKRQLVGHLQKDALHARYCMNCSSAIYSSRCAAFTI